MFLKFPLFDPAADDGNVGGGGDPNPPAGELHAGDHPAPPALTIDALKDLLKQERQATLAEVTKQINGLDAKYSKAQQKKNEPPQQQLTAEQLMAEKQREYDERIAAIEKKNEEKDRALQQKELESEIRSALSDFPWQSDGKGSSIGKDVAFTFYRSQAQRDDDGNLNIGGMPLATYIKQHAETAFKAYHQPRNVGGSGASGSKGSTPASMAAAALVEKANSGKTLTDDEKTALRGQIASLLPGARR